MIRLACLALALLSTGCLQRATRPVRELPKQASAHVEQPVVDFRSTSAGAVGDVNAPLRAQFEQFLPADARPHLRYEPRLDAVAKVLGETFVVTGQPPVAALSQWLLWKAGVVGDLRGSYVLSGESSSERAFDAPLAVWASRVKPDAERPLAYSLVRFDGSFGDTIQVLVAVSDDVELSTLAKAVHAGDELTLTGRFRTPLSSAVVFVDDDDARVRQLPLTVKPDGSFSTTVKAATTPGRRFVELAYVPVPDAPGVQPWRHSAALIPLYVDVPEPTQPDAAIRAPKPNPADTATWPGEVAARYNQRRLELSLPPMEQSDGLEQLARAYATQQVERPETPPDADLPRRVSGLGLVSHDVSQHRGRSEFIDELVRTNLQRPGFRADLLAPGRLAFGFGLAPLKDGEWESSAVIAAITPKLDPAVENAALLERLQALRKAKGLPALITLPVLSTAAQQLIEASCASGEPLSTLEPVLKALEGQSYGGSVKGATVVGSWIRADSFSSAFPDAVESSATHVAIGSCQFSKGPSAGRQLVGVVQGTLVQGKKR